jgi:hypothetical protein
LRACLGRRQDRLNLEFTQHEGDEMYHPTLGGYNPAWSAQEQQPARVRPNSRGSRR